MYSDRRMADLSHQVKELQKELKEAKEERHKFDICVRYYDHLSGDLIVTHFSKENPVNVKYLSDNLKLHLQKYDMIRMECNVGVKGHSNYIVEYVVTSRESEEVIEHIIHHMLKDLMCKIFYKLIIK